MGRRRFDDLSSTRSLEPHYTTFRKNYDALSFVFEIASDLVTFAMCCFNNPLILQLRPWIRLIAAIFSGWWLRTSIYVGGVF